MLAPNWPCQVSRHSSNQPVTTANGCIISRLPTRPLELASPSGQTRSSADSSSSRAVPTELAARITTSAGWWCSAPDRSIHTAPVASPAALTVIRRTLAPTTSRAPAAMALGQWVRSVEALAPSAQPEVHTPRCTHRRRPS